MLAACKEPGASVAAITLAHGLNANLLHKWRRKRLAAAVVPYAAGMVVGEFGALPLLAAPQASMPADIRVELRCGATTVNITGPVHAAGDCAV